MKNIFTSKITIIMSAFGAFLSLVLSLTSGTDVAQLFIRLLLSTLIMGGIAILIQFLVTKFIPQEHLDILTKGNNSSSNSTDEASQTFSQGTSSESTGAAIDYTDEGGLSAEDLYRTTDEDNADSDSSEVPSTPDVSPGSVNSQTSESVPDSPDMFPAHNDKVDEENMSGSDSDNADDDSFQATDFTAAPRIKAVEDTEDNTENSDQDSLEERSIPFDDGPAGIPMNPSPSSEAPSSAGPKGSVPSSGQDVSFTVDKKKINADPKLIAKAIRTALAKD